MIDYFRKLRSKEASCERWVKAVARLDNPASEIFSHLMKEESEIFDEDVFAVAMIDLPFEIEVEEDELWEVGESGSKA